MFLSTGAVLNGQPAGFRTVEISSNNGVQQFTFASGTAQSNIIWAINRAKLDLGFGAAQSDVNPARVAVSSIWVDAQAWVRIKQIDGSHPDIIFRTATSQYSVSDHKDYGQNTITLSPFRP